MRRLPVYLLLDTSGSMYGEPIEAVKNGVQTLISTLRSDPYALETAYISIITFNSSAQQVTPLTELAAFQQPNIDASGCTALGGALELLSQKIDTEITKTTAEVKGDWRPLVFIMTDGEPTDSMTKGLDEFKKHEGYYCFHAGTKFQDGQIVTNGGRVLGITAKGKTLKEARKNAYDATEWIQFANKYMRHDIGKAIDEA